MHYHLNVRELTPCETFWTLALRTCLLEYWYNHEHTWKHGVGGNGHKQFAKSIIWC